MKNFELDQKIQRLINAPISKELLGKIEILMNEYHWGVMGDGKKYLSTPLENSIYSCFVDISFIFSQFIDFADYEHLFVRSLELIKKVIAENIQNHKTFPELLEFKEEVKEFMRAMINHPKYRDKFNSLPDGFD